MAFFWARHSLLPYCFVHAGVICQSRDGNAEHLTILKMQIALSILVKPMEARCCNRASIKHEQNMMAIVKLVFRHTGWHKRNLWTDKLYIIQRKKIYLFQTCTLHDLNYASFLVWLIQKFLLYLKFSQLFTHKIIYNTTATSIAGLWSQSLTCLSSILWLQAAKSVAQVDWNSSPVHFKMKAILALVIRIMRQANEITPTLPGSTPTKQMFYTMFYIYSQQRFKGQISQRCPVLLEVLLCYCLCVYFYKVKLGISIFDKCCQAVGDVLFGLMRNRAVAKI